MFNRLNKKLLIGLLCCLFISFQMRGPHHKNKKDDTKKVVRPKTPSQKYAWPGIAEECGPTEYSSEYTEALVRELLFIIFSLGLETKEFINKKQLIISS